MHKIPWILRIRIQLMKLSSKNLTNIIITLTPNIVHNIHKGWLDWFFDNSLWFDHFHQIIISFDSSFILNSSNFSLQFIRNMQRYSRFEGFLLNTKKGIFIKIINFTGLNIKILFYD